MFNIIRPFKRFDILTVRTDFASLVNTQPRSKLQYDYYDI